ncbi:hypothetical protein HQ550_05220 [bacterium]|nr:hypothetical protein [bacterium]
MFKIRFVIFVLVTLIFVSFGCESFRKKFIRKPKDRPKEEEMVIFPKDYSKQQLPSDEAYMQYYTYWKSWHNELISHLVKGGSKKKIISCFEQTILNLNRMKDILASNEKVVFLDEYIAKILSLDEEVKAKSLVMISMSQLRNQSERLLRAIERDFAFSKVKDDLR